MPPKRGTKRKRDADGEDGDHEVEFETLQESREYLAEYAQRHGHLFYVLNWISATQANQGKGFERRVPIMPSEPIYFFPYWCANECRTHGTSRRTRVGENLSPTLLTMENPGVCVPGAGRDIAPAISPELRSQRIIRPQQGPAGVEEGEEEEGKADEEEGEAPAQDARANGNGNEAAGGIGDDNAAEEEDVPGNGVDGENEVDGEADLAFNPEAADDDEDPENAAVPDQAAEDDAADAGEDESRANRDDVPGSGVEGEAGAQLDGEAGLGVNPEAADDAKDPEDAAVPDQAAQNEAAAENENQAGADNEVPNNDREAEDLRSSIRRLREELVDLRGNQNEQFLRTTRRIAELEQLLKKRERNRPSFMSAPQ